MKHRTPCRGQKEHQMSVFTVDLKNQPGELARLCERWPAAALTWSCLRRQSRPSSAVTATSTTPPGCPAHPAPDHAGKRAVIDGVPSDRAARQGTPSPPRGQLATDVIVPAAGWKLRTRSPACPARSCTTAPARPCGHRGDRRVTTAAARPVAVVARRCGIPPPATTDLRPAHPGPPALGSLLDAAQT